LRLTPSTQRRWCSGGNARRAGVTVLAVLVLPAAPIACSDDDGDDAERYGAELREQFVADCTAQDETEPVCGCFYDALAANVPFERFQELDDQIREGAVDVPADIVDLAVACGADPTFATSSTAP
jgi:hypothetical protein